MLLKCKWHILLHFYTIMSNLILFSLSTVSQHIFQFPPPQNRLLHRRWVRRSREGKHRPCVCRFCDGRRHSAVRRYTCAHISPSVSFSSSKTLLPTTINLRKRFSERSRRNRKRKRKRKRKGPPSWQRKRGKRKMTTVLEFRNWLTRKQRSFSLSSTRWNLAALIITCESLLCCNTSIY